MPQNSFEWPWMAKDAHGRPSAAPHEYEWRRRSTETRGTTDLLESAATLFGRGGHRVIDSRITNEGGGEGLIGLLRHLEQNERPNPTVDAMHTSCGQRAFSALTVRFEPLLDQLCAARKSHLRHGAQRERVERKHVIKPAAHLNK